MGLKLRAFNTALTIIFIAFPVNGVAVKRSIAARYNIPAQGLLFSGCMGIESRSMNVLEWGFNDGRCQLFYK